MNPSEDVTEFWKCKGKLEKYDRPCPQKLMFYNVTYMNVSGFDVGQLKKAIEIKCPRCGAINGGRYD